MGEPQNERPGIAKGGEEGEWPEVAFGRRPILVNLGQGLS